MGILYSSFFIQTMQTNIASLYIHVPFCSQKCWYCSFPVIPIEKLQDKDWFAAQYRSALSRDIAYRSKELQGENKPKLYTIYFGWGTPLLFWSTYIQDVLDEIKNNFDLSELQEITIECNPYPYEQTLQAITDIIQKNTGKLYSTNEPRIRFSCWIQSSDDDMLQISGRETTFEALQNFTKDLVKIKETAWAGSALDENIVINYDFIVFWEEKNKEKRAIQNERISTLIAQKQIDSFSLYTLELFPWSQWYHGWVDTMIAYNAPWDNKLPYNANEEALLEEYEQFQEMFIQWWYQRYEISNYALPWKESLHNNVYWEMKPYIGVWLGAHWFLQSEEKWLYRTKTPLAWKKYIDWPIENIVEIEEMTPEDVLIEWLFLWLRHSKGIWNIQDYNSLLVERYQEKLEKLAKEWYVVFDGKSLSLTNIGMNVHHHICTSIMKTL